MITTIQFIILIIVIVAIIISIIALIKINSNLKSINIQLSAIGIEILKSNFANRVILKKEYDINFEELYNSYITKLYASIEEEVENEE